MFSLLNLVAVWLVVLLGLILLIRFFSDKPRPSYYKHILTALYLITAIYIIVTLGLCFILIRGIFNLLT